MPNLEQPGVVTADENGIGWPLASLVELTEGASLESSTLLTWSAVRSLLVSVEVTWSPSRIQWNHSTFCPSCALE